MDHQSGSETPDSGVFSEDSSRRSSVSTLNGQVPHGHWSSSANDSGLSTPTEGSKKNGSTSLDSQKLMSALQEEMELNTQTREFTNTLGNYPETKTASSFENRTSSATGLQSKRTTSAARSMQVNVNGPNGKTVAVSILPSDSVDKLIRHATSVFGMGTSANAFLSCGTQTLEIGSGLTVEGAGIQNQSKLQLLTRNVGG